ncbi:pyridoxamine 5'-phosphate oxidase [Streptomyces sp. SID5785]|uniref:pyridoxamine 5'-phosphate oxidase n=1 Tax=Streptomyces sp. SID5785 TaxID=2690309 RepID=UPI001360F909|nr:pyridoxamine 5'-phosphate oxidase [Streptomyces sp. SID5785]MZD06023.1 pyridoxamine 5'-phosphate oxidase [Streptomyces sp. SID5785]
MREQYRPRDGGLLESDLAPDPMRQFGRWFAQAARPGSPLAEPNAMVVATADPSGRPASRTVLLKSFDAAGFVFYTNYGSRKAQDIAANPQVALLFPWHPMSRQVHVSGTAVRTSREETAAYFRSRPHGSQLGAWASAQSSVIASREELDAQYAELLRRHPPGSEVPVPPHWGGFRVAPESVEFWQGRENRLHDRLRYVRTPKAWRIERLSP